MQKVEKTRADNKRDGKEGARRFPLRPYRIAALMLSIVPLTSGASGRTSSARAA